MLMLGVLLYFLLVPLSFSSAHTSLGVLSAMSLLPRAASGMALPRPHAYGIIFLVHFFLELYLPMCHVLLLFCCILLFYISPKLFSFYVELMFYGDACCIGRNNDF